MSANQPKERMFVSVIIPCRNEASDIEKMIVSVLGQQFPRDGFEILVADGRSNDSTRDILTTLAARESRIRVIDNPGGIVSTGLNLAIQEARGEIVVRMDAHTVYAPDYVQQCVKVLEETGADNVGGPWIAQGKSQMERAVALAFASPVAGGGGRAHDITYSGPVDTVYLGCWRRQYLLDIGGFDEELVRNQDDELNLRIHRRGGRVWQSTAIRSWYRPRGSLPALFRQYAQYGYWKVRVIRKHRIPASLRHLVPGAMVAGFLLLTALAPFFAWSRLALLATSCAYLALIVGASLATPRPHRRLLPFLPAIFACYHFGYGWGFLRGVLDFIVLRRAPSRHFAKVARMPSS